MEPAAQNEPKTRQGTVGFLAMLNAYFELPAIFIVFALYAGWPIPDVNEAHYLTKATHYWNPDWCRGDQFLESADAHQVFYWTFGWVTLFVPLPVVAAIGRCLTWFLLAWSWRRLNLAICPKCGGPILAITATLLVFVSDCTQMAGEWIVGGIEAKGFAFVLLFLALESLVRGRWNRVWLLLGGATAFHVLIGGWAAVICFGVWLAQGKDRPSLANMWSGLLGAMLLAAPSVWFGLRLSLGVDPASLKEADRIQFVERLYHHLDPFSFNPSTVGWQVGLFATYLAACICWRAPAGTRRVQGFVIGSAVVVLCGFLIAIVFKSRPELAQGLLRFYWFRMFDVALPIGIALLPVVYLPVIYWDERRQRHRSRQVIGAIIILGFLASPIVLFKFAAQRGASAVPRSDKFDADYADWRETCEWVSQNTAAHDLFLTPALGATFKFYANRPDVVTWKDMPQDAPSVLEFWRRMQEIHASPEYPADPTVGRWRASLGVLGTARLRELAAEYHANYVIVVTDWPDKQKAIQLPPLDLELVHHNAHYAVYRF